MDQARSVAQRLARGKRLIEHRVQGPAHHRVATAALAIFAPRRQVARQRLQAKSPRAAQPLKGPAVVPGGPEAGARDVHPRTVSPRT